MDVLETRNLTKQFGSGQVRVDALRGVDLRIEPSEFVAIARALAIEPALLLADEPTGNLDSRQTQLVTELLRQLVDQHGQTIVTVTHDTEVGNTARRVILLRDGVVESDTRQAADKVAS